MLFRPCPCNLAKVPARQRAVLVLLAGAAAALATSIPPLTAAARWTGTPGALTVGSCYEVGSGRQRQEVCAGTFRSDDGRTVDPNASITQPLSPGTVVPVQRTPSGGYDPVGLAPFCGWLAVALFGSALAGMALLIPLTMTRRFRLRRPWLAVLAMAVAALASALVGAIAGAVSG